MSVVPLRVQRYGHLPESRSGKRVGRLSWAIRIEAHHGEHSPCGHRARIIIARNTVRLGREILLQKLRYHLLCTPFLTPESAEKVGISDIRLIGRIIQPLVEHALQLLQEHLPSAHQSRITFHIVRHEERVVPCTAFVET